MKIVLIQLVVAILLTTVHVSDQQVFRHFNGGSLSFDVIWSNDTNKWQVRLDVLTGWVLGFGPCGQNCSKASLHHDTKASRLASEQALSPKLFGNWSIEYVSLTDSTRLHADITSDINKNSTGQTIAMNTAAQWEQEWLTVTVNMMENTSKSDTQDIIFEGSHWHNLSLQGSEVDWHIQTRIDLRERADKGRPNSSPKALVKPFYRLKLNKPHKIYIPAIDPDDDSIQCEGAQFVEARDLDLQKTPIPSLDIHTDDEGRCVVDIDTSTANGFYDDNWLAIPVVLRDYNKETYKMGDDIFRAYFTSLSSTSTQFLVQVLENLEEPEFVEPTQAENHEFFIFGGASWTTEVHAKSSINATIDEFAVLTRLGEPIVGSDPIDHPTDPLVKYITMSWTPSNDDKGSHIVCVRATDSTGVDTESDRCFLVHVLPGQFNRTDITPGKPYFVDLPYTPEEIGCKIEASCVLALFVKSDSTLDKIEVKIPSSESKDDNVITSVGTINQVDHNGQSLYQADLIFTNYVDGLKEFCLTAYDVNGIASDETCVRSAVYPPDPCIGSPCRNSGACRRNPDNWVDYKCDCLATGSTLFGGKNCELKLNPCKTYPCISGRCLATGGKVLCFCNPGYSGTACDIEKNECSTDPCGANGVCVDEVGHFSCQCFHRYNGSLCSGEVCPAAGPSVAPTECQSSNADCATDPCNGNGICLPGPKCLCSSGYKGPNCGTARLPSSAQLSIIPPTLAGGSKLTCYYNETGLQPCDVQVFVSSPNGPLTDVHMSRGSGTFVAESTVDPPQTYAINGLTNTFMATITVQGSKNDGKNFVCIEAKQGVDSAERCFELFYTKNPLNIPGSGEAIQKDKDIKFVDPSPKAGTRLRCQEGEQCPLLLYTTLPVPGPCNPVVVAGHSDVGASVAKVNPVGGTSCVSEVVYSFPAAGEETICFMAGPSLATSQTRCFKVDVYPQGQDPCLGSNKTDCQNDGECMSQGASGQPYCTCLQGYEGSHCEKGPCLPREDNCGEGYCLVNNTIKTCLCVPGHAGPTCDTDLVAGIPDAKETGSKFTNLVIPETIVCYKNRPCSVPFMLSGMLPSGEIPDVKLGFISPGIKVSSLVTEPDGSHPGVYQGTAEFMAKTSGTKDVCLQTLNDRGENKDEICFKLTVTTNTSQLYYRTDRPYFVAPSIPANSTVRCEVDTTCHVLFQATSGDGNEDKCITTEIEDTEFGVIHIDSACDDCVEGQTVTGNCSIDLLMRPKIDYLGSSVPLCINLGLVGGVTGEQRCFHVKIETSEQIEDRGSCRSSSCLHGGFCDGHNPTAVCFCTQGFSGDTCANNSATNSSTDSQMSLVGDKAIPQQISCSLNETCTLPLQLFGPAGVVPHVSLGYVDPTLDISGPRLTTRPNGNKDSTIDISPSVPGLHTVCMQTNNDSLTSDEVCVAINVENTGSYDQTKPHFVLPTLPGESILACETNQSCHVLVYYAKDNSKCPTLTASGISDETDTMHIFNTEINTDCSNDILYTTTTSETHRLCLQLSSSGKVGEKRCFQISAKDSIDEVRSACSMITCDNGAKCVTNLITQTPDCICTSGFKGDDCSQVASSQLPGVKNLSNPLSNLPPQTPKFDGTSGILETITCSTNEPCTLPVPYLGNTEKPPVSGFVDPSLHLDNNQSVVTPDSGQPSSHLLMTKFTPTKPGTHKICMQTTVNGSLDGMNIDEVCFNVSVDSTAPTPSSPDPLVPHFTDNSSPTDSTLLCLPDQVCHIHVQTSPNSTSGTCAPVKSCDASVMGLHIFEPQLVDGVCFTDVGFKTDGSQVNPTSLCLSAGPGGDERNYTLKTKDTTKGFGPCQSLHCQNGGICVGESTPARCYCPPGFKGDTCEIASNPDTSETLPGVENLPTGVTPAHGFIPTTGLPAVIKCTTGEACSLPILFTGSVPPVPGYTDLGVQVNTSSVITPDPDSNSTHLVLGSVTPTSPGNHTVCLQTTSDATQSGVNVDEVCFVVETSNPTGTPAAVDPNNPFFDKSNLPDKSTVRCGPDTMCHIPIVTTPRQDGQCSPVGRCDEADVVVHMFPPQPVDGLCVTDVGFITGQTDSNTALCLTEGPNGENRTVIIQTTNSTFGPCQKVHCLNGGVCKGDTTPAKCVCKNGFQGDSCDIAVGATDSLPGVKDAPTDMGTSPHFDPHSALPDHVTCVAGSECTIPIPYNGDSQKPPIPGYVDPSLGMTPDRKVETTDQTRPDAHLLMTSLTPTVPGIHTLCMQTTQDGLKNGTNMDEVCMNITVAPAGTTISSATPGKPQFSETSLSNGTTVTCAVESVCHLPVITDKPSNGPCPEVQECGTGLSGVHVFDTRTEGDKCYTDVGYRTGTLEQSSDLCVMAGPDGEERHFTINTANKTEYGPCQKVHCINGGICKGDTDPAKCVCTPGFEGDTCETAANMTDNLPGVTGAPTDMGTSPHFDPHSALPDQVTCVAGTPCTIPIPYNGDSQKPPIPGYVDPSLSMTPDSKVETTDQTRPDAHLLMTTLTPTVPGIHTLCMQTTQDGLKNGTNLDEVCMNITVAPAGTSLSSATPGKPQFSETSLSNGTTVTCPIDSVCHLPVVTDKPSNEPCPMVQECGTGLSGVHVFDTRSEGDKCYTDVGYRTGVLEQSSDLCVMAGPDGEERHFTVNTANKTEYGPCQKVHCINEGICKGDTDPAKCVCTPGFEGDTCETAVSANDTLPGVTGAPTDTGTTPHFDPHSALPDHVTCVAGTPCTIPIAYNGDSQTPPTPGYIDPSLSMTPDPKVESPDQTRPDAHLLMTSLTPTVPGIHTLCMQTTQDGLKNGTNLDEVCMNITVAPAGTSLSSATPGKPQFSETSLSNGTTLTCQVESVCHLPVITDKPSSGQCPEVKECGTGLSGVHVFDTSTEGDKCYTDVGYRTGALEQSLDLCVLAGPDGEERHFTVNTANKTEYGPCQKLHCIHGGICKGDTEPAKCVCPPGYKGNTCDTATSMTDTLPGVTGAPTDTGTTPHFDPNSALPDHVTCVAGTPCTIPIPYNGDSQIPPLPGYVDPSLDMTPDSKVETTDQNRPDAHLLMTSLTPTVPGTHTLCMQTTQDGLKNGTNIDEVCMNITVAPAGTSLPSVTPGQPKFSETSLSNGTTVTCQVDSICHLPVITDKPSNGPCPDIEECGTGLSGVHVFDTRSEGDKCYTDVGYRTGVLEQSSDLCVLAGPDGEERHFTVNTANKIEYGPCQKVHCSSGGKCKGNTDPAKCVCPPGFKGDTCDTAVSTTDTLPGVTGAPTETGTTPHFDTHSALPDHVTCVAGTPCTIPIPYNGDSQKPPVTGYVDPSLSMTPDLKVETTDQTRPDAHLLMTSLTPTVPGIHTLCMQTTQDGLKNGTNMDEVCMNITVAPAGTSISSAIPGQPKFSETTLSNGTTVTCQEASVCHLPVITDRPSNGPCPEVQECGTGLSGVHVFDTRSEGDKCYTDVGYRTGTQEQSSDLCVMAGPDGEERHYEVKTATKTEYGPCQKVHCINGGICKGDTDPAKCVCPSGFQGNTCNTAVSPTGSLPGVTGAPTDTGTTPHFDPHSALPDHVTCVAGTPCTIPIPYNGDSQKPPSPGYLDPGLTMLPDPDIITPNPDRPNSHVTMATVVPVSQGEHKLCIQTTTDGTQFGTNIDEICVDVTVQPEGTILPTPQSGQTTFHETSLPNGTTVTCLLSSVCHLQMVTQPDNNNKCPQVEECGTGLSGVHVFEAKNVDGKCYTDVGYRSDVNPSTADVCLRSGPDGEERHYTMKAENKTEFGPCQTLHCVHGSCSGLTPTPECFCEAGYDGNTCNSTKIHDSGELLQGISNSPVTSANTPLILPSSGIPETVSCITGSPCTIPLLYTGNKDKPPVVGYVDPRLAGSLNQNVLTPDPLNPEHNMALTTVTPDVAGNQTVCLHTTTNGSKNSMNVDAVCFQVIVTDKDQASKPPVNQMLPHFHPSTLSPGSSVTCRVSSFCHLPVITDPSPSGTCEPVHECGPGHAGIHGFQSRLVDGVCVTDVGYKTGSQSISETICVAAGPNGEERNFTVATTNTREYSPCQKLHCQNGGACKDDTTPAVCVCQHGYNGDKCHNGAVNPTNLPGVFQAPSQTPDAPHFDGQTAVPSNIKCYANHPCTIPIRFHGNSTKPPVLGYKDPSLGVDPVPDIQTVNPTSHMMVTSMTPTTPGEHRVCVQTTDDGTKSGQNVDEICVLVTVDPGSPPTLPDPHFEEPTLTNESTVVCQKDNMCHIPVTMAAHNGNCDPVFECGQGTSGVHMFDPQLIDGQCVTDLGYKTASTEQVTDMCVKAGPGGEERHFTVNTTNNHEYGPCQKKHCQHGGACLAKMSGDTCLCTAGFKGDDCENAVAMNTSVHLPGMGNISANTPQPHSFVPTSSIPDTIQCHLNEPCTVPVAYTGSNLPLTGFVDPVLTVTQTELTPDAGSSQSHVAMTTITPTEAGNHALCLQTSTTGDQNGMNLDEMCFKISVSSAPEPPVDTSLPHFGNSTLTDGSTLTCLPDIDCHIPVTTVPNQVGECDPINECPSSGQSVHIFQPKIDNGVCVTDIIYNTASSQTTKNLCLSAGPNGENRTFSIQTTDNREYGPCQKLHCENGGSCAGNTATGSCSCRDGFLGRTCEIACENGGVSDEAGLACICPSGISGNMCQHGFGETLPTPVNTSTDQTPPRFTDLFLPEVVTCEKDQSCDIAIPVVAPCNEIPHIQNGFYASDLNVAAPSTTPVNQAAGQLIPTMCRYESIISITPTETGQSSYCAQTTDSQGNNADELCFKIDTQDPGTSTTSSVYVTPPTVPNNTVLACIHGKTCHTSISLQNSGPTCDNITLSQPVHNVNIFEPASMVGSECKFDVAFTPDQTQAGNTTVCFHTGTTNEDRCLTYDVKPVEAIESVSPCRTTHCEHSGFCKSSEATATCICRPATSGQRCEIVNTTDFIGSVPESINCTEGQPCSIMIPVYTSPSRVPTVKMAQGEANVSLIPASHAGSPHQVAVHVGPNTPLVCVNITTDPMKPSTQKCVEVQFSPANSSIHSTDFPPSTPKYQCIPDEQCTLSIVTKPNNANKCPSLKVTDASNLVDTHVFETVAKGGVCISEVVTTSSPEAGTADKQVCLATDRESKCFPVTYGMPDQCSNGATMEQARLSTDVGMTKCYCMLNNRKVQLIHSTPVSSPMSLIKTACIGAASSGGIMLVAMAVTMVTKMVRKPDDKFERSLPPTPRPPAKIFPRTQSGGQISLTDHL